MLGLDLLMLEGYKALRLEEVDEKLYVHTVAIDPDVPSCDCEAPDVVKHGKRVVNFRDHSVQRRETYLRITRQRYRCRNCASILLEKLPFIDDTRRMTVRFREQLIDDGIYMKFAMGADVNGVKESLIRRVFKDYAKEALADYTYELPRVLGMDEKVLGGKPRFVVGDVENRLLLDILMSRKQENLEDYFKRFDFMERANVEVITQDMYWGYKTLNEQYFRKAVVVVDKFHVLRYADFAVTAVRKLVQSKLDNEGRIEMKNQIALLQARPDRLGDEARWKLKGIFKRHPLIEQAVTMKEWFYDIYNAETRAEAEKAFEAWKALLPPEMERPFKPILSFMREKRWRRFVFNYFDHPFTNGYVEAVNGLLDEISRSGRGYDLETLRAKALLRYGTAPYGDIYKCCAPVGMDLDEFDKILDRLFGHGIDLSTFMDDLREGTFW